MLLCFFKYFRILLFLFLLKGYNASSENPNVLKEFVSGRQLFVYKSYKDIQLFHFSVPFHVSEAIFNLTSNHTDGCSPRNISIYLQPESYPLVNPSGFKNPSNFWVSRQRSYETTLWSDLKPAYINVKAPQHSDWFLAAFINDDSKRITQDGLFPSCYAWLQIDATYFQEKQVDTISYQTMPSLRSLPELDSLAYREGSLNRYYRFFAPARAWDGAIVIENCAPSNQNSSSNDLDVCPFVVRVRPKALPTPDSEHTFVVNCSGVEWISPKRCVLTFPPSPFNWHYFQVVAARPDSRASFHLALFVTECSDTKYKQKASYAHSDLIFNDTRPSNDSSQESNALWNPAQLEFADLMDVENMIEDTIQEFQDGTSFFSDILNATERIINIYDDFNTIGINNSGDYDISNSNATLFNVSTLNDFQNYSDISLQTLNNSSFVDFSDFGYFSLNSNNASGICWPRYQLVKKTFPGSFSFEFDINPGVNGSSPLIMNLTNSSPTLFSFDLHPVTDIGGTLIIELVISPFVNTTLHNSSVDICLSAGIRSVLIKSSNETKCSRGRHALISTTSLRNFSTSVAVPYPEPGFWFLSLYPSCWLQNTSRPARCATSSTPVIFSVSSSSCVVGKCGRFGSCFQYISGGFMFSTCVCSVGYQGYSCNDDSAAVSDTILLLSTLLLCLSNIFFLPAIILALIRRYYTEAVVYGFTMIFSALYHACDQDTYSFCLIRLNVLQFCDFFSAILSFWVTLIAMADLPSSLRSILHMSGAMFVALGIEYNRRGIWVFAVPAISALVIMIVSWVVHCRRQKQCYPVKNYWIRCLLPGTFLATIGLICYAFLETENNYFVIHSLWHVSMALSILCLLPSQSKEYVVSIPADGEFHTSDDQSLSVNLNL